MQYCRIGALDGREGTICTGISALISCFTRMILCSPLPSAIFAGACTELWKDLQVWAAWGLSVPALWSGGLVAAVEPGTRREWGSNDCQNMYCSCRCHRRFSINIYKYTYRYIKRDLGSFKKLCENGFSSLTFGKLDYTHRIHRKFFSFRRA